MARDHIRLLINGQPHRITGGEALLSLSDYLRHCKGLIGTKIVCSEGDCGACTVLVARTDDDEPRYRPIDACITWMFQLDQASLVTIEGLANDAALHPVQEAMVNCHGSQCGFCTPGFVMTMAGLADDVRAAGAGQLGDDSMRCGLTGNLCRCTGYIQILDAGRSIDLRRNEALLDRYPVSTSAWPRNGDDGTVHIVTDGGREVFIAATVEGAAQVLATHPTIKIVSGATDVGVALNKGLIELDKVLYIGRIASMRDVTIAGNTLRIGAAATWAEVDVVVRDALPPFADIIRIFGAPQIRHSGTIGGNVINASPIADSLPLLFVTDAKLRLVSAAGERWVGVNDFYLGYKKLDLMPTELLAEIQLMLPTPRQVLRLYKVSKRRDLDISTFTAAILLTLDGSLIAHARLAYGGVAPVVLRLPRTEAFLCGKTLSETVMTDAGAIAREEISPITDVRASADYRFELAQSILARAYFDIVEADAAAVA